MAAAQQKSAAKKPAAKRKPAAAAPPLLEARGVEVEIGGTQILRGADLVVDRGQLVAILGPNGAGKSTLARAVSGLQDFSAGSVRWSGRDVREIKRRELAKLRAFVPQRAHVPAGISVREAVTVARSSHLQPLQRLTTSDHEEVDRAMARARILKFEHRPLTTLSGGELQRVQIAIGLAQGAPVLIADEPTAQLDLGATVGVARLLRELADDEGIAILVVVHDLSLASEIADSVVVMSEGRSVTSGSARSALTTRRLAEVWNVDAKLVRRGSRTSLQVDWLPDPT